MNWQLLLKAAPSLPDTKEKYLMMLGAPTGAVVVRQMIEGATNRKGFRLIPKWNQQIINTNTNRLARQYPNIPNTDVAQEAAKELKDELNKLSSDANKGPPDLSEKLLALIEAKDFEGLEKFIHLDIKNPGHRKKVIQVNANKLKSLILQADPVKALPVYYYDTTEYKQGTVPDADISKVSKWVTMTNGRLTFKEDTIPPYIKNQLEKILNGQAAAELDTEEEVATNKVKIKLKPSKLVKYIGADIYGQATEGVDENEYAIQLAGPESVLAYLQLLVQMGIRNVKFIPGPEPRKMLKLALKKHANDSLTIYPALRVILREPEFNINDWRVASKGTRMDRSKEHHKNRLLMSWESISPELRRRYKAEFIDMGEDYLPLRELYKKSATQRLHLLETDADMAKLHENFLTALGEKLERTKHLFSIPNYKFLLALEERLRTGDIDTPAELAEYLGIPDDLAEELSLRLEVILDSEIFDERIELKDLFKEPPKTDDIHPKDGMLFNSSTVTRAKKLADEGGEDVGELLELVESLQSVFSTLHGSKQQVTPAAKGQIISQLRNMKPDQLNVENFEVTSQTLEDIIEMIAQLDWLLRDGKLMREKNRFIQAIKDDKVDTAINKFLAIIMSEYPKVRKSFEEALKEKLEELIESPEKIDYYTKLVKKKGDFYGRLQKLGLINRVG